MARSPRAAAQERTNRPFALSEGDPTLSFATTLPLLTETRATEGVQGLAPRQVSQT